MDNHYSVDFVADLHDEIERLQRVNSEYHATMMERHNEALELRSRLGRILAGIRQLCSQEGCDGPPYDDFIALAEGINPLAVEERETRQTSSHADQPGWENLADSGGVFAGAKPAKEAAIERQLPEGRYTIRKTTGEPATCQCIECGEMTTEPEPTTPFPHKKNCATAVSENQPPTAFEDLGFSKDESDAMAEKIVSESRGLREVLDDSEAMERVAKRSAEAWQESFDKATDSEGQRPLIRSRQEGWTSGYSWNPETDQYELDQARVSDRQRK